MGLRKLPKKELPSIDDIIDRGGEVLADKEDQKKKWTNFTLRIPKDLLEQIDSVLDSRIGISKTGWILEAIQEKLHRIDC